MSDAFIPTEFDEWPRYGTRPQFITHPVACVGCGTIYDATEFEQLSHPVCADCEDERQGDRPPSDEPPPSVHPIFRDLLTATFPKLWEDHRFRPFTEP